MMERFAMVLALVCAGLPVPGCRSHPGSEAGPAGEAPVERTDARVPPLQEMRAGRLREILRGLEGGMEALHALGRHEEAERLVPIARDVRARLEQGEPARGGPAAGAAEIEDQLEVLRLARSALREAGRHDAADLVVRAIRAREVELSGRDDPEAVELRRLRPSPVEEIELLIAAEDAYRELGLPDRADLVSRGTEMHWGDVRRGERPDAEMEDLEREMREMRERLEALRAELQRIDGE